jgi:predicted enzyme related to lactoylglutathione lyase
MAKVLGVGGVFFKSPDPQTLNAWYVKWLGLPIETESGVTFCAFYPKTMPERGYTVWSAFGADTKYFNPSEKEFMFNLVVDDIEAALAQVKEGGAAIIGKIETSEYGRFGWFMDPDGNKVELWQPGGKNSHG